MQFSKISGATAALLISMISASPIALTSDVVQHSGSHVKPTGSIEHSFKIHSTGSFTAEEPIPTSTKEEESKFTIHPSGGKNEAHHFRPSGFESHDGPKPTGLASKAHESSHARPTGHFSKRAVETDIVEGTTVRKSHNAKPTEIAVHEHESSHSKPTGSGKKEHVHPSATSVFKDKKPSESGQAKISGKGRKEHKSGDAKPTGVKENKPHKSGNAKASGKNEKEHKSTHTKPTGTKQPSAHESGNAKHSGTKQHSQVHESSHARPTGHKESARAAESGHVKPTGTHESGQTKPTGKGSKGHESGQAKPTGKGNKEHKSNHSKPTGKGGKEHKSQHAKPTGTKIHSQSHESGHARPSNVKESARAVESGHARPTGAHMQKPEFTGRVEIDSKTFEFKTETMTFGTKTFIVTGVLPEETGKFNIL
ncbi:hypothetical protein BCIN_10g01340 [Botrytis cinerea B05.10]|uniref:Uncharacterized protein n=1 Tax=Botryotinia fuckeliana (strain B05.10) TaxID=332648 RepID=A0A384JU53_BOTFB|nr:hypothetical protein BCIN_10g01340 [Botrytis cinerea B05.10]ATZ54115.1 hypothetical protein BCIN_10g01340 [Botrytis cinerea B05.10]